MSFLGELPASCCNYIAPAPYIPQSSELFSDMAAPTFIFLNYLEVWFFVDAFLIILSVAYTIISMSDYFQFCCWLFFKNQNRQKNPK